MEIDLALLADAATIDGSGKLNILGIFDRLGTHAFPTRHPRLVLVLRFSAGVHEVGRHDIGIALKAPDGGEVLAVAPHPVEQQILLLLTPRLDAILPGAAVGN